MRLWLGVVVVFAVFNDFTSAGFQGPNGFNSLTEMDSATASTAVVGATAQKPLQHVDTAHQQQQQQRPQHHQTLMEHEEQHRYNQQHQQQHQQHQQQQSQMKWSKPYFDAMIPKNVTALVGKSAYLSCKVRNLGNKTVSWIRHRDIHILTVGAYTYTSDQRFQATYHKDTDDWTLQIKWAQKRDAGMYECQISTQPVRSFFVHLNVVVPTAAIVGGPDLHVDKGSTINLTCAVKYSPEPPAYIFWYHHDEVISYDSVRGGVSVITEKGNVTTSYLLIQNADLADSGKYSCSPSNADVVSVRVHVLNGEHPEAMQTNEAVTRCSNNVLLVGVLLLAVAVSSKHVMSPNATRHHHETHCRREYVQRTCSVARCFR